MLTLNDGRSELWQWDTGRTLSVDADCTQVHFSNKVFGRSIDVDVVDGVAIIPDILLQTDKELNVWAFVGTAENGYTKIGKTFKINRRNKPADYVFTPTDQTTLSELVERLDEIEESQDPDAIKNAVDEYLANNPIRVEETDPTVPAWAKNPTKPKYTANEVGAVATVNGTAPDENGNVEIEIPEASEPDMTGYATERYVQENYQPKGNYLTEVPEGYAKTEDIPTKPGDIGAQPAGNYLTEVPDAYATKEFVTNKIAEAELGGEEVDLSGYAQKSELPTKVSELENDAGYLTEHQDLSDYAKKTEIPVVPVQSVNGKTGSVKLSASDVGARPDSWIPTAQEVGALPSTYTPPNQTAEQVGADPKGTATTAVSQHNVSTDAHGDIRLELKAINNRLTAFFDSDDQTMDELSEIVAYITSNKSLIDAITTSKVSVSDIVNNLTANVTNKPLSAAQGVVLKGLIDAVSNSLSNYALASSIPTKVSQLTNDSGYLTQHQDVSGKLDASKLPEAINTALAQAKASGEFNGEKGDKGDRGDPGEPGQKGDKGDTGATGAKGEPGKDGTSATHSWNGTVLTITSASGTSSADLKGAKGDKGQPGLNGMDGTSVTVKSVSESTADGGSNVVTFSDGKTLTIKNGSKGSTGATGPKPARGVDYWTSADQESIVQDVIRALGTPVFGRVDADNNIILTGELADGTYTIKYEDADGTVTEIGTLEQGASYKNWADPTSADWLNGQRLSTTGEIKPEVSELSNYIPVTAGQVVRVRGQNLFFHGTGTGHATQGFYNSEKVFIGKLTNPGSNPKDIYGTTWGADNEPVGDFVYTVPTAATFVSNYTADDIAFMRFSGRLCSGYTKEDIIITVDQEITD